MKVNIKWNKRQFSDMELDPTLGIHHFKNTILDLTGIPVDRQKLVVKGILIKEDKDFVHIKEGQQIMLMGNSATVVAPKEPTLFVEDMTAEQKAEKGAIISSGMVNLGNTCYMNSVLQCFRHMPDLRNTLNLVNQSVSRNVPAIFTVSLRDLFNQLDRAGKAVTPMEFVSILRGNFPQFAQTTARGGYMQQDAEEFYNTVIQCINNAVVTPNQQANTPSFLNVEIEETLTCIETDSEVSITKSENLNKLVCNIQGGPGASVTVNNIYEGLKLGLGGNLEKYSEVLQRNALWNKTQRVSKLPKFICVQFMRFFWKPTPESRDHAGVKCKILRPVAFTEVLDLYEFCSESLQEKLKVNRSEVLKRENEKIAQSSATVAAALAGGDDTNIPPIPTPTPAATATTSDGGDIMEIEDEDERALQLALALSLGDHNGTAPATTSTTSASSAASPATTVTETQPISDPSLPCAGFTGNYELFGVVTHKGRSADSGHYIAWVRQSPGSDYWWKYDDESVSELRSVDILELKGGGDWHTAYLNFYRYKE